MKRRLTLVFFLILLLWGGYHAAVWYGGHQFVRELASEMGGAGDLRWDGVRPGLEGRLEIRGIRWHWFDITEPVQFERMVIETPGPLALLRWLYQGHEPEQWALGVEDVRLHLRPDLFRPWAGPYRALYLPRHPLHLPACGEREVLTAADFLKMGIDRVAGDLKLSREGPQRYNFEINAGPLGSAEGQFRAGTITLMPPGEFQLRNLKPETADLVARDAGLMRRLSSFCAAASDRTVDDWTAQAEEHWREGMENRGLIPSAAMTDLYRRWLRDGGELAMSWSPSNGWPDPDEAMAGSDWQARTGFRIAYNGVEQKDVEMELAPERRRDEEQVAQVPIELEGPKPDIGARFHESDVERAAAWIDRRVRLSLESGREIEGELVARDARSLHIRRMIEGGEVIAPFAISEIEEFAVWRRSGDPGRPIDEETSEAGMEGFLHPGLEGIQPIPTGEPWGNGERED